MNVRFIYDRWEHHNTHSGYDIMVPYLGNQLPPLNYHSYKSRIVPWRIASHFVFDRAGMRHYSHHHFYVELTAALAMIRSRRVIYHIMEGDFGYRYLGLLNGLNGNQVIATYHLPPQRLASDIITFDHLKRLSAIIVVGKNQIPFFEPHVDSTKLHWVPLGVDTNYFKPVVRKNGRTTKRCLFVGRHMRDLTTLKAVVKFMEQDATGIETVIVTSEDQRSNFEGIAGVKIRSGIPETELLELYQNSDLLLLPLKDATAVIALLEGLACGLPAVATNIGAIPDYVDGSCAALVPPRDPKIMHQVIGELLADEKRRHTLAENARQRALQFDWSKIVCQMQEVYSQVLS